MPWLTTKHQSDFERTLRLYLRQARDKLNGDGRHRETINLITADRAGISSVTDRTEKEEREFLKSLIITAMRQSFCYGYGIGKFEGNTNEKVYL